MSNRIKMVCRRCKTYTDIGNYSVGVSRLPSYFCEHHFLKGCAPKDIWIADDLCQEYDNVRIIEDEPDKEFEELMNAELKQNARPYVEEYYSWKSVAKSIGDVYRELIEESQ